LKETRDSVCITSLVNMVTGKVINCQALIRWQHQPRVFAAGALPLNRRYPISIALGEWVIATALTQMKTLAHTGTTCWSASTSGRTDLQHDGFAARLGELLAEQGDQMPHRLQLEVLRDQRIGRHRQGGLDDEYMPVACEFCAGRLSPDIRH
jgi:EAL domain-containing protein (putative c-di-GMP-specific phosphodiesterase class I)